MAMTLALAWGSGLFTGLAAACWYYRGRHKQLSNAYAELAENNKRTISEVEEALRWKLGPVE